MLIEMIRHGETALQKEKRYQGSIDPPLSEEGRAILRPSEDVPDLVIVTDLRRTKETAEILFPMLPVSSFKVVPGLSEMHFGKFEGRSYSEMADDPDYRAWVDGMCQGRCPGGESKEEFCKRTTKAFSELMEELERQGFERAAIVAHGGTLMAVLEAFGTPEKDYFDWKYACGQGCLLSDEKWKRTGRLLVKATTDYRRKGLL